ncbi:MAG: hypothetical protein AAF721_04940 [Myxococcota bacterium]
MADSKPQTVICRYVAKPGKEAELETLLRRHWRALHELGLATDTPAKVYRGLASEKPGGAHGAARTYVEIFEWKSADAPNVAHQTPAVMAVWEPMGALCEDMDFPHFDPVAL